jgi:hypothetical protein
MELANARATAIRLMTQHGLISKGWTFQFDRALYRLGLCDHVRKRISISKHFTGAASEYQVEQAVLHEIAHALLPLEVRNKHKKAWKDKALEIGYMGSRLAHNPFYSIRHKR